MNGDERKLLEARLADCVRLGEKRPAFLGFLELSERAEAEAYLRRARAENWCFFGGWEDAERVMLGVFPDYLEADASLFPLLGLTVRFGNRIHFHTGTFSALSWHRALSALRSATSSWRRAVRSCL